MPWIYLASIVLGYLLGSIPTGYLVGRRYGIDIREHGSKNIGATNVVRVLGKRPGYLVFFCDALKGLLAVRLATWWARGMAITADEFTRRDGARLALLINPKLHPATLALAEADARLAGIAALAGILAGLACILGHNFPAWLRFRGGKGVATTIGVLLGLMPLAVALAAVVWAATFFLSRYVSLASILAAAALPAVVWWLSRAADPISGPAAPLFWFSVVAALLIVVRHRANISRLLHGTEPRFDRKPAVPPPPAI